MTVLFFMSDIEFDFDRANEASANEGGHVTRSSSWADILRKLREERESRCAALWGEALGLQFLNPTKQDNEKTPEIIDIAEVRKRVLQIAAERNRRSS